jgi:hypothetical protein
MGLFIARSPLWLYLAAGPSGWIGLYIVFPNDQPIYKGNFLGRGRLPMRSQHGDFTETTEKVRLSVDKILRLSVTANIHGGVKPTKSPATPGFNIQNAVLD